MRDTNLFEDFPRARITELRLEANVSEHRMSLELGKSESYIRSITSGRSLPSFREFFVSASILVYLRMNFLHLWRAATQPPPCCPRNSEN